MKIGGKDVQPSDTVARPPDIGTSEKGQTFEETPLLREQSTGNYCIASIVYRGTAHYLWQKTIVSMEGVETTEVAMPSAEEIKKWKRTNFTKFLVGMKGVLELDDKDFQKIMDQKLDGPAFLDLTQDDLMKVGMPLGPAKTITRLVKELKGEEQEINEIKGSQLLKRTFEEFKETQSELLKQNPNGIKEFFDSQTKKPRSVVSLSNLNRSKMELLLEYLELSRKSLVLNVVPTSKKVQPFQWDEQAEDKHAEKYLSFLNRTMSIPSESMWYNPVSNKQFLSVDIYALPFSIKGTADVVVTKKAFFKTRNVVGGIQVVFKLKKKIEDHHVPQAIGELIVANILSEQPVFVVLTDLKEEWIFYWLSSDKEVLESSADLCHAITIFENALGDPEGVGIVNEPDFHIARRCNFRAYRRLMDSVEDSVKSNEDGLEKLINRPKVDFEFQDDVANMSDVFDMMTPEEILNWKLKRVSKLLAENPGFQNIMLSKDY
ncbi:crinkler family protein [Gigaspora margarita]|uniref:Crinkler family protein n=1 Tax=Gigaspora margarita TaxID=4874 RepID=A0A8H3WYN0_GIGMA|nr:crinkler family protein [Gigaspora margarita]